MPLIKDSATKAFDLDAIHKGDLIRAQYHTWPEPRNGVIAAVSGKELAVLYLPGLGNVSNYFPITASEVEAGLWTVKWSSDLETINTHGGTV